MSKKDGASAIHGTPGLGADPYSLAGPVEGSAEASGKAASKNLSPKKQKRAKKTATEVNAQAALPDFNSGRERAGLTLCMNPIARERNKLIIFNVHGTLVDCSLDKEKNPNCRIRPTVRTRSRRVYFRPWLVPFLSRCFMNFAVAFWGSKSKSYMDDIIPMIMGRQRKGPDFCPLFVWAGKDCEAVDFEGPTPIAWGKSLSKVYGLWPRFNPTNTLVIDSKVSRVSCNPAANVVINKPFYVAPLAKLADDNEYLKVELWPMLEELCDSADISHFRSRISGTLNNLATEVHELTEEKAPFLDSKTLEGEGTCEPRGS